MKRLLSYILTIFPVMAVAQDKPQAYFDASLVSHYMWRGQDLANVCFQPEIGVSWKGLTLSLEGNTGFAKDDYEEIDVNLDYVYKGIRLGFSDLWTEDALDNRYFYYGKDSSHQFEGFIGYECDYGSLTWHTIFAGNDYKLNGERAYSSFIELAVPFKFYGLDWDFGLGICPYESSAYLTETTVIEPDGTSTVYQDTEYYYAKSFAVNMLSLRATKTFDLKKLHLPVFVEVHTNPAAQRARVFFGISITNI